MQIKKNLLIGILFVLCSTAYAQNQGSISGTILDEAGIPLPGIAVKIKNSTFATISENTGKYFIGKLPAGKYVVVFSGIGNKTQDKTISISAGEQVVHNVKLASSEQEMETVEVFGRTKAEETNRQAFNVTAIDAKKLYNTTLDISSALDRVSGVRVRESGGVGSNFNLSLNGFSGNRIRYFIDGIPMDNFGSSFQINNIPVNLADRIEVYKGVVPMWLGSDALGGAINIVTAERAGSYLDASYSFGSFNTHRTVVNVGTTSKSGFTVQVNAFQNYSDNNYRVKVDASDINTGKYAENTILNRFHDTYHNETVIANVGLVNKSFADKLLIGMTLGQNYKEIQTGARMVSVFGGFHTRGNIVMPSLKYRKSNLVKGLDVTLNANYNLGREKRIDTVNGRFDWYGNLKPIGSNGESSRSLYNYRNNNGLVTATANYTISDRHSLALSNVLNLFDRKGFDELRPLNTTDAPPQRTNKNVLGLGYSYAIRDKFSATAFGKYIYQNIVTTNTGVNQPPIKRAGYGTALTYFFNRNVQVKASYELANRMPEANDIFGDLVNQEGNPNLKPEKSNNINLGVTYDFAVHKVHRFGVNANAIYRYANDFIYTRLNQNQSKYVPDNRDGVRTYGGDAEVRYSYKNWLSAGVTATYQFLQNMQKVEAGYTGESPLYLDQMPNIPYFFGNADVSVSLKNVGGKGNSLNLGYNLLYVHEFYLYWPSLGQEKYNIPQQFAHDLNAVYSMKNGRYNIGLEAKNITDAFLYDNFSLQKPSRAFYLNIRYFFNKNHN
ncbi:TonB-dependent receptor [Pedobacter endophyticus]|uniref:TonB-dependent receptor n=1 Tax=Pedobacter endophyticus TaxID=2789740 RepID=A0A7S9PZ42_9SPHI|nr:TonB-dependent receptor [Pedobacter endophyticus]QPH39321.1 TonB-dependent receptor [Pedobacter endophyticus]